MQAGDEDESDGFQTLFWEWESFEDFHLPKINSRNIETKTYPVALVDYDNFWLHFYIDRRRRSPHRVHSLEMREGGAILY